MQRVSMIAMRTWTWMRRTTSLSRRPEMRMMWVQRRIYVTKSTEYTCELTANNTDTKTSD